MIKKTITYKDYNGAERTEDFYFHLSKTELMEMELSVDNGLSEYMQLIVNAQDGKQIMAVTKDVILKSYGEKSMDGRFFDKSETLSNRFYNSPAYDVLFTELVTDAIASADFFKGIMPDDLEEFAEKTSRQNVAPIK